MRSKNKRPKR